MEEAFERINAAYLQPIMAAHPDLTLPFYT